jgi:ANTAR domain/GAF domain
VTVAERLLAAVGDRRGVWAADKLCEACVALFDVDAAAISLVLDGVNAGTLGASGAPARVYDELQFTLGEGPCLDSVAHRAPVLVADLADPAEVRWPAYGPAMLAHGLRGVYALPVVIAGEYAGALELFCSDPAMLGAEQLAGALMAAELAQLPLLDLLGKDHLLAAITDPDNDAWAELNTLCRVEVSQATGMLVAQLDVGPAEALVRLRGHAYATGRSVTTVARDIIDHRLHLGAG